LLQALAARDGRSVECIRFASTNLREREVGELQRIVQALCTALVMNCELHACVNACGFVGGKLVPEFGGLLVFAAPFRQERQFSARLPVVFPG
jgi:hypothetical protein